MVVMMSSPQLALIPFGVINHAPRTHSLVSLSVAQERYVASLMPLQRNISPYRGAPTLRQFDVDEFVASIEHSGPQLTSGVKGD